MIHNCAGTHWFIFFCVQLFGTGLFSPVLINVYICIKDCLDWLRYSFRRLHHHLFLLLLRGTARVRSNKLY